MRPLIPLVSLFAYLVFVDVRGEFNADALWL